MLLAFFLILFSDPDDLLQDLHVEALSLGPCEYLFRVFGKRSHLFFYVLYALNEGAQLITRYPTWSAHGFPLVNLTWRSSSIGADASSRVDERGNEAFNMAGWLLRPAEG